ncbi:MAG: DUF456 domain-containing protein [Elusimicrobiota bacterium]|jgi:uncharacterized protein YqgC (DUF456 family)|nr:DUF456 domain-containing protein [Elusimicrobiota bacterium]
MDLLILIISILFVLSGFAGCFLPILPGPPLALVSLVLIKFTHYGGNIAWFWIGIFTVLILIAALLEYFIQVLSVKKSGGSSAGVIGAAVGVLIGLFFMPFGIILCPFLGAFIGEMIVMSSVKKSLKAAFATFWGFLLGVGIKLIICFWISAYFIINLKLK